MTAEQTIAQFISPNYQQSEQVKRDMTRVLYNGRGEMHKEYCTMLMDTGDPCMAKANRGSSTRRCAGQSRKPRPRHQRGTHSTTSKVTTLSPVCREYWRLYHIAKENNWTLPKSRNVDMAAWIYFWNSLGEQHG